MRTTMRWWAMPSRTRLGSSFSAKSVLSASARAIGIGDLAVAHDAGPELGDRAAGQGEGAIDADFGGGEVAGVELEADDAGLGGTLLAEHECFIGMRATGLKRARTPWVVKRSEAGPRARFAERFSSWSWGLPAVPDGAGSRRLPDRRRRCG